MTRGKRCCFDVFLLCSVIINAVTFHAHNAFADAKQSTLNVSLSSSALSIDLLPTSSGSFGESEKAMVSISTENFTGYTLAICTNGETSLINAHNDEIESVTSNISSQSFASDTSYNNKWGFRPDQYVLVANEAETLIENSDFLPAPATDLILAKTTTANSLGQNDELEADLYGFSFGARADMGLPAGTYTGTFVLTAIPNTIVYNVTYDKNTEDDVSSMPSPNPQVATIDGGTPEEESFVTLSDSIPIRDGKTFIGWCEVMPIVEPGSENEVCPGATYQAGDELPIDQTAGPNITLYAIWADTTFPVVWSQMGACEFHGATNSNITGSACNDYHDVKFIDTGIALYSQANYLKDFELHFTLDHYIPSEQVDYYGSEDNGQQTFVSDKLGSHAGDGKAPGILVRRATTNIDFNTKFGDEQKKKEIPYSQVHDVSMFRLDNKIYYSYDGGPLTFLQDITGFNQQFDLTTWFGAYPRDNCDGSQGPCTNAKRIPEATMSNMYIRLGEYSDDDIHTINFKANDGTTTTVATSLIKDGNTLTTVPTAPIYADHYFQGWFTAQSGGTEVTASTVPSTSADYYAHWLGSVAVADIDNPVISLEPNETEMIVVNNASELEPYSFSSSNDNVVTVNSTTGEITAVGSGTATITMTGATSGATKTVSVTVSGQVIQVTFDSQGGTPASYTWDVGSGSSFTTLPEPTREDYQLKGWWTGPNGAGTELTTSTVFDSNTPTQYYAKWEQLDYVCKIAKPDTLHVEQCDRTSDGCKAAGFATGADIEYGQLVSSATMTAGDAYDCDINNDGEWDDEDERFYYFGTTENNAAKFIYYRNISTDNPVYDTAITYLPTSSNPDWSNPNLATFNTGDYSNTVTRFMTYPEALALCDNSASGLGTNGRCIYLLEKSAFAYTSGYNEGIWLEKQPNYRNRIQTKARSINHNQTTVNNEVRPVIEVPLSLIEKYIKDVTHAVIANNDLTTTVGGQFTIVVSNSAELEPYTFSSADTSIATVDDSGIITGVSAGTTNIIMTGSTSTLTKTLEVEVTDAQTIMRTVTFNPDGGSFDDPGDSSRQVEKGAAVGALPTPTKANHMFFGWYKDNNTFYEEVYPEEIINDAVTYYAKWVEDIDSFPIVWAVTNACTFNGTSNLTGDYCLEDAVSGNSIDKAKHYIDTAVQLFTQANFQKDFEVGFNIVSYDGTNSTGQATFVNSKAENLNGWPGFTLRRSGSTANLELTERFSMNSQAVTAPSIAISSVNQARIARIGEKIYYSWNGAPYTLLQDIKDNTTRFDTKVWFGAALDPSGNGSQRPIYATFTDMYIKLGVPTDYVIELDVNDGTMSDPNSFTVPIGSQLGALPTPTPPNENYTFIGWFDESVSPAVQVTSTTVPDGNKVYVAHYAYDSSDEPVIFNIANDALQGYQTLINSWVPNPINITTFNQSSPINNSTWGNTQELSEKNFWQGIKDNFENNLCSIPSYGDAVKPLSSLTAWGNGSVDCSKPKAYDTKIGAALNVYLDDENGEQVTYANATNGIIHNMVPGQTYYWEKADDSTVYGYVTATSVNGRRPIELSANRNTRDLGGLPVTYTDSNNQTVTGTLAYGRLFRGERLWSTPATELYNLGINKQYDVGDPSEYANDTKLSDYKWDPVIHYNFDYNSGDEDIASSNYMKAWTAVTDIMTDITSANDPKNIYFHCRVGADRTGTTAYLLEGLLGVPDEARYEEYELTNLSGLYDRTRYYKQKSSTNNLKFVFMMEYVKTNADILNWYMSNPNSDMGLVQAFRSAMTVSD